MSFDLVKGDLAPAMPISLLINGVAVDTTGATVVMHWVKPDGTLMQTNLTVVDANEGEYLMTWSPGDTDQVGYYFGLVVVTIGGVPTTYPSNGVRIIWFINPAIEDYYNC